MDDPCVVTDVALHVRAKHAEGPRWDAVTGRLWWVDIIGQRIHCFDPASGGDCSWPTSGQPGGLVLDTEGGPVVATPEGLATLDLETGTTELRVPIEADRPGNRANDVTVDGGGRVWVGTMAFDIRPEAAALYRVDGDRVDRVVDGLTISNGPAFDEAGGRMYLADTPLGVVDVPDVADFRRRRRRRPVHNHLLVRPGACGEGQSGDGWSDLPVPPRGHRPTIAAVASHRGSKLGDPKTTGPVPRCSTPRVMRRATRYSGQLLIASSVRPDVRTTQPAPAETSSWCSVPPRTPRRT